MKVKLKTARCGDHFVQEIGQVVDLPDAEAERMIQRGQAEKVESRNQPPAGSADRR